MDIPIDENPQVIVRIGKGWILLKWPNNRLLIKLITADENNKDINEDHYRLEFRRFLKPNEDISKYIYNPIVIRNKIVVTNLALSKDAAVVLLFGLRFLSADKNNSDFFKANLKLLEHFAHNV